MCMDSNPSQLLKLFPPRRRHFVGDNNVYVILYSLYVCYSCSDLDCVRQLSLQAETWRTFGCGRNRVTIILRGKIIQEQKWRINVHFSVFSDDDDVRWGNGTRYCESMCLSERSSGGPISPPGSFVTCNRKNTHKRTVFMCGCFSL